MLRAVGAQSTSGGWVSWQSLAESRLRGESVRATHERLGQVFFRVTTGKKLAPAYEKQFKANRAVWEFFCAQAPWYQRTSSFWVVSAKQEETRKRRLATLICDSEKGRRLGILTPKAKKLHDSENRQKAKKQPG